MAHYQTTESRSTRLASLLRCAADRIESHQPRSLRRPGNYPTTPTTFRSIARDAILSELHNCSGPNSARRAFRLMADLRDLEVGR
jgi:hypothetical protein